jgi:uncharacterized protein
MTVHSGFMDDTDARYRNAERLFSEKRYADAFRIYQELARTGDINSQIFVGWMYHEGLGTEKSETEALRWFAGAANLGSKAGAFYCAKSAIAGRQYDEAQKWLQESAKQEYGPALLWLGLIHIRGMGVPIDFQKGVGYLQRAAATGNFPAKREMALLMMRGRLGISRIPLGFLLLPYSLLVALIDGVTRGNSDRLMG